jgi:hypothetical protein
MKTTITLAAIAATLMTLTAPAMVNAQPLTHMTVAYNNHFDAHASADLNARINNLQTRIDMGKRTRQLSFREASRLSSQLSSIISTKRSFERSGRGLDGREVATLNSKLDDLSARIHVQAHDGNHG